MVHVFGFAQFNGSKILKSALRDTRKKRPVSIYKYVYFWHGKLHCTFEFAICLERPYLMAEELVFQDRFTVIISDMSDAIVYYCSVLSKFIPHHSVALLL